ncbi:MAG TPA: UDP-N-acetylmuramoyl-tripeptide--D-alanyl-D-alanine ligase [Chloroflexia bacterium]|nr:UDP-N-acetylmuramoyl-tripeptide--D-alanyl-D-alanine ligase [Chloroflexia bacterium]
MLKLTDILAGTGGTLDPGYPGAGDLVLRDVVIDSRQAGPGSLFVALSGASADGHAYIADAVGHGAQAVLAHTDWQPAGPLGEVAVVRVADTLRGLQALATWWRGQFPALKVIAITGSIGKTSTKEYTSNVLARCYKVLRSEGNLNSETGLPLSVLRLEREHEVAVFELGGGAYMGEISKLAAIAQPQVGVITNVSHSHLASMGTMENLAHHKGELVRALPANGVAVLNYDDDLVRGMAAESPARVVTYGLDPAASLWADAIESQGLQGVQCTLHHDREALRLRLPLLGVHSVHTALRAAAACEAIGMNWKDIVVGLQTREGHQLRLLVAPGINGTTLIDDSYNANPASMLAALNLLLEMPAPRVAVLGDMLELGSYEQEGHIKVARRASDVADLLVVVGPLGRLMGEEALRCGMAPDAVFFAATNAQAVEYLRRTLTPGAYVLVKGSHGMHMDEIVEELRPAV